MGASAEIQEINNDVVGIHSQIMAYEQQAGMEKRPGRHSRENSVDRSLRRTVFSIRRPFRRTVSNLANTRNNCYFKLTAFSSQIYIHGEHNHSYFWSALGGFLPNLHLFRERRMRTYTNSWSAFCELAPISGFPDILLCANLDFSPERTPQSTSCVTPCGGAPLGKRAQKQGN